MSTSDGIMYFLLGAILVVGLVAMNDAPASQLCRHPVDQRLEAVAPFIDRWKLKSRMTMTELREIRIRRIVEKPSSSFIMRAEINGRMVVSDIAQRSFGEWTLIPVPDSPTVAAYFWHPSGAVAFVLVETAYPVTSSLSPSRALGLNFGLGPLAANEFDHLLSRASSDLELVRLVAAHDPGTVLDLASDPRTDPGVLQEYFRMLHLKNEIGAAIVIHSMLSIALRDPFEEPIPHRRMLLFDQAGRFRGFATMGFFGDWRNTSALEFIIGWANSSEFWMPAVTRYPHLLDLSGIVVTPPVFQMLGLRYLSCTSDWVDCVRWFGYRWPE